MLRTTAASTIARPPCRSRRAAGGCPGKTIDQPRFGPLWLRAGVRGPAAVVANPRYGAEPAAALGDLIVASMPSCVTPVRAMIDAYDRYFGQGTGEAFFMGPYLDVLPKAVTEGAKNEPE